MYNLKEILVKPKFIFCKKCSNERKVINDWFHVFFNCKKDGIEELRKILQGKMNEVIKVLTIISAIFIPITFVAGVYGMNFDFMPELHSKYGYMGTWAIIILIAGIQITYFKKRKWL